MKFGRLKEPVEAYRTVKESCPYHQK